MHSLRRANWPPNFESFVFRYIHPVFDKEVLCPIIVSPSVDREKGTAVLHLAPGHSVEDFRLGRIA